MLDLFRQVNWSVFIPHGILVALISFLLIFIGLDTELSILASAVFYLGLSMLLQRLVPFHHRMGFRLLMQKDYENAALAFQQSWENFNKNSWLDKYRSVFMLSASKISYREMALINRSLCYWQMGDSEKALKSYEEVLKYFPNSKMAIDAIDYIKNPDQEETITDNYDFE